MSFKARWENLLVARILGPFQRPDLLISRKNDLSTGRANDSLGFLFSKKIDDLLSKGSMTVFL
jgi:hypothetical protein